MSMDVLLGLALLAAALGFLKWRRTARGMLVLALLLFVVEGCGLLPKALLHGLQAPYAKPTRIAWTPRNVIVLLGSGTLRAPDGSLAPGFFANGRIIEALVLYRECKATGNACKIEVSGGDALHTGESEAAVYDGLLQRMGVPAADLLLEARSMNTWQNAEFSAPLLRGFDPQRVVLVSSAMHLRRASLYFAHFGVSAVPARGDWTQAHVGWWPGWSNFAVTDRAMHEYLGVLRYHVYNALGWNLQAVQSRPGSA